MRCLSCTVCSLFSSKPPDFCIFDQIPGRPQNLCYKKMGNWLIWSPWCLEWVTAMTQCWCSTKIKAKVERRFVSSDIFIEPILVRLRSFLRACQRHLSKLRVGVFGSPQGFIKARQILPPPPGRRTPKRGARYEYQEVMTSERRLKTVLSQGQLRRTRGLLAKIMLLFTVCCTYRAASATAPCCSLTARHHKSAGEVKQKDGCHSGCFL